ncbi:MAG: Rod shape-determining protein RodA [candidate division WS6 bacterium GW2011_GWA2_37_6]|uniref:Rod shape-determining protein RodA n=1 Tax=candidate division WS6 bacterium GW2011_GWA2_37_6 TaxID=1619087 RepID=A0A0G0H7C3_9BACT|nr:MAG: Rod shape-determining protein RodA [candidate division WS6 bacterium GW2011_GWA2_37_6]
MSILSIVLIYSTTFNAQNLEGGAGTFKKQILFFIVGFFIYFLLSTFDLSWLQNTRILFIIYLITILFLVYVKFFTGEIASTNRWITILGFSIQPAEYAKITLTIVTAVIFSHHEEHYEKLVNWKEKKRRKSKYWQKKLAKVSNFLDKYLHNFYRYIFSFLVVLPIMVLVFIQPALGNSFLILLLWLSIVFASSNSQLKIINFIVPIILIPLEQWGIINANFLGENSILFMTIIFMFTGILALKSKLKWYLIIFAVVFSLAIKPFTIQLWESNVLKVYQKERIETFFEDPEKDPLDAGFQVRQSKIAIGAGQFFGRGYLQGTQSTLKVLPFAHTDFIFASLAEQFGMVGSLLLILIYLVLLVRIEQTAGKSKDEFAFLLATGVCIMLLLNIFINIGMNMGKLPVTGVPLPLVSYGGSSVIVNLTGLGLIQAARRRITIKDVSESFIPRSNPWT